MIIYEIGSVESGIEVKRKILNEIKSGNNVILFPEGRMNSNSIGNFKLGSLKLCYDNNIPIQLLCLRIPDKNFRTDESKGYVKVTFNEILQKILSVKKLIFYDEYYLIYPSEFNTFELFVNYINKCYEKNYLYLYN